MPSWKSKELSEIEIEKFNFSLTLRFRTLFRLFINYVLIFLPVTLTAGVIMILIYKVDYVEIRHFCRYISSNVIGGYSQISEYQSILSI